MLVPALVGVCALLSAAALGFGIYGLYQGVADWKVLNDVDKGELVVGGASTIMEMLAMVGKTSAGFFAGEWQQATGNRQQQALSMSNLWGNDVS